jgi:HEAT repeat protein
VRQIPAALDAYEKYVAPAKSEDGALLASIARASLQLLATEQRAVDVRPAALERLAAYGDLDARNELALAAAGEHTLTREALAADTALARLGDQKAVTRLGERLFSPDLRDKIFLIDALVAANARASAYLLVSLLQDRDPVTRSAAADALGALGAREAVPQLQELLTDEDGSVRLSAAASLKQLGSDAADEQIAQMLMSPAADVRLMAAEALANGKRKQWVEVVRPMLQDPNGLLRLHAAKLFARVEPVAARDVLVKATSDQNPVVRDQASTILESIPPYDLALMRRLLRDSNPIVRVRAAGAILKATASPR